MARSIDWARRVRLERKLTIFLLIASVVLGITTFAATTGHLPGSISKSVIWILLLLDFILVICLVALVLRRVLLVWSAKRKGQAGARLHARFVSLFALVAVTPAIVVAVFSAVLFDFGLRVWFSDKVSTVVRNSLVVAEAYLEEHQQTVQSDALAVARAINSQGPVLLIDNYNLSQLINQQVGQRSLQEALIFQGDGTEVARGGYAIWAAFDARNLPTWVKERARAGEVVVLADEAQGRVGAVTQLDTYSDTFLYVGRQIDPTILGQLDQSRGAVQLYDELEGNRYDLQITFALIFIIVTCLLLLVAMWVGLTFANSLTSPIGKLISAAEKVAGGDLSARVPVSTSGDEIASLALAFNRMTSELSAQRGELLDANRQVEQRRRFIEAVLGGTSAGVVGLDGDGRISLLNRAASELLGGDPANLRSQNLSKVMPEFEDLRLQALAKPGRQIEKQMTFQREDGEQRTVLCRLVAQVTEEGGFGLVSTFDDMTELVAAQRKAAWSDIARRIAHEIKNPLTPIQLSAERLKRKYLPQITNDPETFKICTDTIVRQVGDIGRMVDEFSSFARMPAPIMAEHNLRELAQQALFLQQSANPDISYSLELPEGPMRAICDIQQISRALNNILLNAAEAIEARLTRDGEGVGPKGEIALRLRREGELVVLEVDDNGRGLPKADRHRLTEPYVTTRPRGTGLGLAIVKKIMEEHSGSVLLDDAPSGGARVRLSFPASRLRTSKKTEGVIKDVKEQA